MVEEILLRFYVRIGFVYSILLYGLLDRGAPCTTLIAFFLWQALLVMLNAILFLYNCPF